MHISTKWIKQVRLIRLRSPPRYCCPFSQALIATLKVTMFASRRCFSSCVKRCKAICHLRWTTVDFVKKTRRCVDFCRANDQKGLQMTFWQHSSFWSLWLLRFECDDLISHNWATNLSSHMNWWLRCTQKSSPRWSMLVPCPVAWPFARPFSKGIHMQNLH